MKRLSKKQLAEKLENLNNEWLTTTDIIRNQQVQIAKMRSKILDDNNKDDNLINDLDFTKIEKNIIPSSWLFRYWKDINNLQCYWDGRYMKIVPLNSKVNRIALLLNFHIGGMYGNICYNLKDNKAYYYYNDNGKTKGFPIVDLLQYDKAPTNFTADDKTVKWDVQPIFDKNKTIELDEDRIVKFQWRIGGIGNYIWYLQERLEYLYIKQIIASNCSTLITPFGIEGTNFKSIKKLATQLADPKYPVKAKIKDINNINNEDSQWLDDEVDWKVFKGRDSHQQDIILSAKFIQEDSFNQWGIPITSSKNQTLSADANLSISTAETSRHIHDELVLNFLNTIFKKLGEPTLDFTVFEDVESMIPTGKRKIEYKGKLGNNNADKEGEGTSNTDGGNLEK